MRLLRLIGLVAVLAGVFAGVASALDFNDEAEEAPRGEVGRIYHFEMPSHGGCTGAPYRYVVESGILPPGLKLGNLNDRAGLVDGIPTVGGTYNAWIALKDHCGQSAELLFTFEIGRRRYAVTSSSLPPAALNAPYSAKLQSEWDPQLALARPHESWAVTSGALPAGLALAADGTIAGTPTAAGASTFTVTGTLAADDGTRVDSRAFTLTVGSALAAQGLSRRVAEVGIPFSSALAATGGTSPYSWSLTGRLPAGLSFDRTAGALNGTPRSAGAFRLSATATDANGASDAVAVRLTVVRRLTLLTRALPSAGAGRFYAARLVTRGGVRPISWKIAGRLPAGLALDARSGTVRGTPRALGSTRVRITARDALGAGSTRTYLVLVR